MKGGMGIDKRAVSLGERSMGIDIRAAGLDGKKLGH
jgi:hypothetical protein